MMNNNRAVILPNITPMRGDPNSQSVMTSQAIFGETVKIIDSTDCKTLIETPDGYSGWVENLHLRMLTGDDCYPDPARAVMVSDLFLPVYFAPSPRAERLTLLTIGSIVEIAEGEAVGVYYPLRLADGREGWADGSALIVPEYPALDKLGPNVGVISRGMIGIPYLWGGRSAFGLDCSGFVQKVFYLCGIILPRDAWQQAIDVRFKEVNLNDVRVGDLLFFASDQDPNGRGVTHVSIMLGEDRMIHSSGIHGVKITLREIESYSGRFVKASRFVL